MVAAFPVKINEESRDKLDRIAAAHRRSRNFIATEAFERYADFELRWIEEVTDALQEAEKTDERYLPLQPRRCTREHRRDHSTGSRQESRGVRVALTHAPSAAAAIAL